MMDPCRITLPGPRIWVDQYRDIQTVTDPVSVDDCRKMMV